MAHLLKKNKFYLSFSYIKILYTLLLTSTSFSTAIVIPYYCHFYINSNTTFYISLLVFFKIKIL